MHCVPFLILSRTVWLSGSGGTGETLTHQRTISGKPRLCGAAELLSDWSRCWAHIYLQTIQQLVNMLSVIALMPQSSTHYFPCRPYLITTL